MKRAAISVARGLGHAALAPLEALLAARAGQGARQAPPCFIIGPPRSGTTLLYEAMVTRFAMAFISNAAHRFHATPLAASWLCRRAIRDWRGSFTSSMGHIDGWASPNEGGWVWRHWLADGDWTDGADLPESAIAGARRLTTGMAAVLGGPFLNKNVMHSNRLLAMHRIWPDARYLVVRRDVTDTARSIVRALGAGAGPEVGGGWRSVRPRLAPQWEGRSLAARSMAQAIGVYRDIAEDAPAVGAERFHEVDYAALCADPAAAFAGIVMFLEATGGAPQVRASLPATFRSGGARPLDPADERELDRTRAELGHG